EMGYVTPDRRTWSVKPRRSSITIRPWTKPVPNDAQLQATLFHSRSLIVAPAQGSHLGTASRGWVVSPPEAARISRTLGPSSISRHLSVIAGSGVASWTSCRLVWRCGHEGCPRVASWGGDELRGG